MSDIKCIFFDFDGVIVPNSQIIALNLMCEELINYKISLDINYCIEYYLGIRGEIVLDDINRRFNTNVPMNILKKIRMECKNTIISNQESQQNLSVLLESIKDMYICSSNTFDFINDILNRMNLKRFFPNEKIFTAECVSAVKPSPEIYLKAISTTNLNLKNCVALEDSVVGILAAKRAGLYSIGYLGGIPYALQNKYCKLLRQAGADKIINCFSELIDKEDLV